MKLRDDVSVLIMYNRTFLSLKLESLTFLQTNYNFNTSFIVIYTFYVALVDINVLNKNVFFFPSVT